MWETPQIHRSTYRHRADWPMVARWESTTFSIENFNMRRLRHTRSGSKGTSNSEALFPKLCCQWGLWSSSDCRAMIAIVDSDLSPPVTTTECSSAHGSISGPSERSSTRSSWRISVARMPNFDVIKMKYLQYPLSQSPNLCSPSQLQARHCPELLDSSSSTSMKTPRAKKWTLVETTSKHMSRD